MVTVADESPRRVYVWWMNTVYACLCVVVALTATVTTVSQSLDDSGRSLAVFVMAAMVVVIAVGLCGRAICAGVYALPDGLRVRGFLVSRTVAWELISHPSVQRIPPMRLGGGESFNPVLVLKAAPRADVTAADILNADFGFRDRRRDVELWCLNTISEATAQRRVDEIKKMIAAGDAVYRSRLADS